MSEAAFPAEDESSPLSHAFARGPVQGPWHGLFRLSGLFFLQSFTGWIVLNLVLALGKKLGWPVEWLESLMENTLLEGVFVVVYTFCFFYMISYLVARECALAIRIVWFSFLGGIGLILLGNLAMHLAK